jgi:hypothetical protein
VCLQNATTELGDTKLSLKEAQAIIGFKEEETENITKQHGQELNSIKEKAEFNTGKALLEGDQKHQKIIGEITEKLIVS